MVIKDEIVKRIKKKYTVEAICNELNLSVEQLYLYILELRKDRIFYYPNIEKSGLVTFSVNKDPLDSDVIICVPDGDFSFVSTSDPHVGNLYDQIDRFRSMEDFANDDRNNIKMIVCNGDLIDGPKIKPTGIPRRLPDLDSQMEEFITEYMYFKGPNICILGGKEHDTGFKNEEGYDIYRAIKEFRPDIRIYGSDTATIRLNDHEILLCHDIKEPNVKSKITDDKTVLSGHSHIYYNHTYYGPNGPVIRIVTPSMSNLPLHNGTTPGFLKLTYSFRSRHLTSVLVDNYTFEGASSHILHNGTTSYPFPLKKSTNVERDNNSRKRNRK